MKIIKYNYNYLSFLVRKIRSENKNIVTINGCFDLIHSGHMRILRFAKAQTEWLSPGVVIVGLNSDYSVSDSKGNKRPILNEDERAEFLLSTGYVDYIFIYNEYLSSPFVKCVSPDAHVNDSSYGEDCIEAPILKKCGGKLIMFPKSDVMISTTALIDRIVTLNE